MSRIIYIGGVKFRSDGEGHYHSECGAYALYHMMRGTIHEQWELYRVEEDDDYNELLDWDTSLFIIRNHFKGRVLS